MRVCRVAPDVPALSGRTFDYLVPAGFAEEVCVGTIVRVELAGRKVRGWIVDDGVVPETAPERLKPVVAPVSAGPPGAVVELCAWTAWRFAGPMVPLLRAASPAAIVAPGAVPGPPVRPHTPLSLRPISAQATELAARAGAHPVSVIRWPPASPVGGLVRALLPEGGSAIVVLPGASDRLAERLREDVGAVVHLATDGRDRDRARAWEVARRGAVVVVGGRSAVLAPVPDLAAVIVLDEGDEALRETRQPTWTAREVARERARRAGVPLTLISPAPTLEALAAGGSSPGEFALVGPTRSGFAAGPPPGPRPSDGAVGGGSEPPDRTGEDPPSAARAVLIRPTPAAERAGWPVTEVVDRRPDPPGAGLFSGRFVGAVHQTLDAGGRVVCVLNRKGRARLLACAACGELVRCDRCGASLREAPGEAGSRSAHGGPHGGGPATATARFGLECPQCLQVRPRMCDHCTSTRLKVLRAGVTKVAGELAALIPRAGVALVEAGAAEVPGEPVIIGTEAVLHRIRRAGLVAFLDFDQELAAPRIRAAEQALWLLVRATRIVGGRAAGGRVLVQTRIPAHEVLRAAILGDPTLVSEAEEARRRPLGLPPFGALARLSGDPADLAAATTVLRAHGVEVTSGEPVLARAPTHASLCDALAAARTTARVAAEIDPLRL